MYSPKTIFAKSFIIAFLMFTLVFTSGMGIFASIGEDRVFADKDDDSPILEEEMATLVRPDSEFYDTFKDSNKVNVLLLGVNTNLTDTVMIASFDPDTKHIDLISVPRDTYFERDGYVGEAEKKLNAAYLGNPVNTAKAVHEVLLGMPINYYAVVTYDGIKEIVDSVGGVPMNIEFDMVYNDPYDTPPLRINIPAGQQVLDGEKSVQFLRYRKGYSDGDIGRITAQQEFMKSAFKQALGFELPNVAKTIIRNVDSDLKTKTILYLASQAIGMGDDSITTWTIPAVYQEEAPYYVFPDEDGIEHMLKQIYNIIPREETTGGAISDGAIEE